MLNYLVQDLGAYNKSCTIISHSILDIMSLKSQFNRWNAFLLTKVYFHSTKHSNDLTTVETLDKPLQIVQLVAFAIGTNRPEKAYKEKTVRSGG